MSKVPLDKMIAYMRGELELPTMPEALAVDTAIIDVLLTVKSQQDKDKPDTLPVFNEDSIGMYIRMMVECEREVAELTVLIESDQISEATKSRFNSELAGKKSEQEWIKRELKRLYDLQILHLRARILDYERERKAHPMDAFHSDQMNEAIRGISVKIERAQKAMSKL